MRSLRERLFEVAIDAYLAAREPQFLRELITEHLDPDSPGAAPASESMQRKALEGLRRGIEMLLKAPQTAQAVADLNAAANRLHEWRVLYFGGTAASARLLAADHERRGGSDQALVILRGMLRHGDWMPRGIRASPSSTSGGSRRQTRRFSATSRPRRPWSKVPLQVQRSSEPENWLRSQG
ncbi:MAG: hypothetical protein ACREX4_08985 [Gammaproteobacteria bacterium]